MARTKVKYMSGESLTEMHKDIARTYGRTADATSLSKKYDRKPSYITGIANSLRGYGVDVARIKRAGIILRAVDELRAENPELFAKDLAPARASKVSTITKRGPGRPRKNQ